MLTLLVGELHVETTDINNVRILMTSRWGWGSLQTGGWLEAENCRKIDSYWEVRREEVSTLFQLTACASEAHPACPGICLYFTYCPCSRNDLCITAHPASVVKFSSIKSHCKCVCKMNVFINNQIIIKLQLIFFGSWYVLGVMMKAFKKYVIWFLW